MPLFCTLANQFATTTTPEPTLFENKGYPLMFETKQKHMFFVDPGEDLNDEGKRIVHKFYGAPLSVLHAAITYNGGTNYGLSIMRATNLGFIEPASSLNRYKYHYNVSFGQSFNVISKITVNDHKINPIFCAVTLPNETQLSLGRSTSLITAKHGESFEVVSSLSVSNHNITPTYTTVNIPESYLYTSTFTTSYVIDNILFKNYAGANIKLMNETKFITLKSGDNISIISGSEYNDEYFVRFGNEVGNTVTISATNTHSVEHGAEMVTASASTSGKTINLTNTYSTGYGALKLFSIIPGNNVYMEFSDNNRDITINSYNTHVVTHVFTASADSSNKFVSMHLSNAGTNPNYSPLNIKGGTGINVTGSGDTFTITNSSTNTDTKLSTISNTITSYLIGKSTKPSTSSIDTSTGYTNPSVFMNSGILYSDNSRTIVSKVHDSNPAANNLIVHDIRVVTALPSNASQYPNTLFLVTGGDNPVINPSTQPTIDTSFYPTYYTVTITINTGVQSINVNGTNYTSSTSIKVEEGSDVTWTATAKVNYYMNTTSGTISNISAAATISPTASKNIEITNPTGSIGQNACPYFSTTRTTCAFTNVTDKAKYKCNSNCGAIDWSPIT